MLTNGHAECMGNTVQLQGCQYQNYLTIIIFHVVSLGAADDLYSCKVASIKII